MDALTLESAKANLDETLDAVCKDHAPVIITRRERDPVVVISLDDYNQMVESVYLLGNPVNAEQLRASVAEYKKGNTVTVELDSL